MASNANVNKVVYGGTTLIDLTGDDVAAADVRSGKKFHLKSGAQGTGTLEPGTDTSDATATASDLRNGKTAYAKGSKITGSMTEKAAATYYPSTSDQAISSGRYLTGAQTIKAVKLTNLSAANIKSGVTVQVGDANSAGRVASVTGTYKGELPATLSSISSPTWLQGMINRSTGANEDATNRVRSSGYMTFSGKNAVKITIANGFALGVRVFRSSDNAHLYGMPAGNLAQGEYIFTPSTVEKFRFVLAKTDDSDFTPAQVPASAITIKGIVWG